MCLISFWLYLLNALYATLQRDNYQDLYKTTIYTLRSLCNKDYSCCYVMRTSCMSRYSHCFCLLYSVAHIQFSLVFAYSFLVSLCCSFFLYNELQNYRHIVLVMHSVMVKVTRMSIGNFNIFYTTKLRFYELQCSTNGLFSAKAKGAAVAAPLVGGGVCCCVPG